MERASVKSRKGRELPVKIANGGHKKGLVFVMHGLGADMDNVHISFFMELFSDNGFTAVGFNAEHTFSGPAGSIVEATATNHYEDLEDVISWASGQDWYDEPFYLVGHSLGALCVGHFAALNSGQIKALVLASAAVSPSLMMEEMTQKEIDEWALGGVLFGPSNLNIGRPVNRVFAEDSKRYDLIKEADRLKMPVILIASEHDRIVNNEHQRKLYEILPGEKEFHVIKGAEHVFSRESEFSQIRSAVEGFIKNNR